MIGDYVVLGMMGLTEKHMELLARVDKELSLGVEKRKQTQNTGGGELVGLAILICLVEKLNFVT